MIRKRGKLGEIEVIEENRRKIGEMKRNRKKLREKRQMNVK